MKPSSEEVKKTLKNYKTVPVFCEIISDTHTPVQIYNSLCSESENSFILESVDNNEKWGRYSFIGIRPEMRLTVYGHSVTVSGSSGQTVSQTDDPRLLISEYIEKYKAPCISNAPAFTGGLVGYFGYDTVRFCENKLDSTPEDDLKMPDCDLFLYNELVAYDHLTSKIIVIQNVKAESELSVDQQLEMYRKRADEIFEKILSSGPAPAMKPAKNETEVTSNLTKEEYIQNVIQAKEHIRNGDIFQIVLSQRFEIKNPPDSFSVYRMLRSTNPSPYLYYFSNPEYCIAGASPEMLVNVRGSVITTKPIAGTIARSDDEAQDLILEQKLKNDTKEQSEHTMLVDLGRNDIGKVSEYGSVKVSKYMYTEKYSKVMHLVSDVEGRLRSDKNSTDALMAVLPAGTLSGAPKIRAMQLIDSFEKTKRGLYGGTIGYLGFDGNMDTCIAIRTVLFKNNSAYIQAGAGITADSVPEKEYTETLNKAYAMINAVSNADMIK
ncbi:MAG: anthranilate synthase component I [Oscillospiraceae bacterium]|nr:anthranilate synthase component I [Oscillospiraceae bacterium]